MNFTYTILYVEDVVRSVEFYQRAFGLQQRFIDDSKQYAELETGTTTLAFAAAELAAANLPQGFQTNRLSALPAAIEVGLVTAEVSTAFAVAVEAGAKPVTEPKIKPWGQTVAYVRDLDGILISINSPM